MLTRQAIGTRRHEAEVAARFDALHARFKGEVGDGDVRLGAVLGRLEPLAGKRVLDLGCGKGRFARHWQNAGAAVVGVDVSPAMLAGARGIDRAVASASRLPFDAATFDAVVAIEVFQHLPAVGAVIREARRVLKPGGILCVLDRNAGAWDARRPWLPSLLLKWVDERRGRWMYPKGSPVRERWFRPRVMKAGLDAVFGETRVAFPVSDDERGRSLFRLVPAARRWTLWTARVPGVPCP